MNKMDIETTGRKVVVTMQDIRDEIIIENRRGYKKQILLIKYDTYGEVHLFDITKSKNKRYEKE